MTTTFRFLGTGDTAQVPHFGCPCPACGRARVLSCHRRAPASAELIIDEAEASGRILLDAGRMDLAERYDGQAPTAILLTHYHADHVQGLFHLRWGLGAPIPIYGPNDPHGCADLYKHPGLLDFQPPLKPFRPIRFPALASELEITPIPLNHSKPTLGYCLQGAQRRLAYLTDTCGLPGASEQFLRQWRPDVVIIDSAHPPTHESPRNHNNVTMAVDIIKRLAPGQGWLTHLSHDIDRCDMAGILELPANVALAQDFQTLTF